VRKRTSALGQYRICSRLLGWIANKIAHPFAPRVRVAVASALGSDSGFSAALRSGLQWPLKRQLFDARGTLNIRSARARSLFSFWGIMIKRGSLGKVQTSELQSKLT